MSFRFKEMIRSQAAPGEEEQSSGCSDVCFFCQRRVYVMERLSAEGLFFHRSCFHCSRCGATLRLAAYGFDQQSGKFYCLQHYNSGLGAPAARRRPTTSDGTPSHRTSTASLQASVSSAGSLTSAERHRRSSAVSVMAATAERIELENRSEVEVGVELLEEVSEETLNQFNLSLEEINERCSSESEMEEEEDEEDGQRRRVTSERARASWREALQLHLSNGPEEEEEDEEDDEEDGEMEEEEEEEQSSEVETSDEGEYSPRDMERRSGMWLLLEEETEEELLISQGAASTAGSDITHCETPTEPDSTSSPLPRKTSSTYPPETPPLHNTPSTASFVTLPDSSQDEHTDTAPPTQPTRVVVMETGGRKHAAWQPTGGRGSFEDIHPELPQKKHLHLQGGGGVEPEKVGQTQKDFGSEGVKKRRRYRGARSLPPRLLLPSLQSGGGALLLHLKGLREAPPPGQVRTEAGGASALWRTVFSGNRKEKKKWGKTLPPGAERTRKDAANEKRDVTGSLTEGSDLDSSTLLHRCSLRPKHNTPRPKERVPIQDSDGQSSCPTEVVGVLVQAKELSSLSVKETLFQRGREYEDKDLDAKITRRVQRVARRKAKQEQLKRLHKAQMIQRQLEQVEEKQRQLEERGVLVEKALRGEADYWGESNDGKDIELHLGGLGRLDNPGLMQQWFQLVQQKNSLVQYESELVIFARELELEDRQSRLQQELRERMAVDDHLKAEWQLVEERLILEEMLEVVEQRDSLVSLLEEQRLQEPEEDHDVEEVMMTRWS